MSINYSEKIEKITDFLFDIYFPFIQGEFDKDKERTLNNEYRITEQQKEDIKTNIFNKLNDQSFLNNLNADSKYELVQLFTGEGLEYNKNGKKYFREINNQFIISTLCAIEGYDKEGESQLEFISDRISYDFGNDKIRSYFYNGNGEKFYNYLTQYLTEPEVEELSDLCDEDINITRYKDLMKMVGNEKYLRNQEEFAEVIEDKPTLSIQKKELLEEKKEAVNSFRNQLENFNIDDIKPKTK